MSAGVFRRTSSRSTKPRTSTDGPEFAESLACAGFSAFGERLLSTGRLLSSGVTADWARSARVFSRPGRPDRTVGPAGSLTALGANGAFARPGAPGDSGEREAASARGSPQPRPQGPDRRDAPPTGRGGPGVRGRAFACGVLGTRA